MIGSGRPWFLAMVVESWIPLHNFAVYGGYASLRASAFSFAGPLWGRRAARSCPHVVRYELGFPPMTLFDLVFLLVALASAVTLLVTVGLALSGRGARAWRLLRAYFIFAAVYMAVVVASPLVVPRRVITMGESLCFDDWCIAIVSVTPSTSSSGTTCDVKFRMYSRARHRPRENNLAIYLVDSSGRRFNSLPRESDVPLNVQLGPGE